MWLTDPGSRLWQLLAEYEQNTLARTYTYGEYVDEPLTLTVHGVSAAAGTYWYHRDRQYNILGLTDSSGGVVERYAYTPYGERHVLAPDGVTAHLASIDGNTLGHQGLMHDNESRLISNRFRYRSSGFGRWCSRDLAHYIDGFNSYIYLRGHPLAWLDHNGFRSVAITPPGRMGADRPGRMNFSHERAAWENEYHRRAGYGPGTYIYDPDSNPNHWPLPPVKYPPLPPVNLPPNPEIEQKVKSIVESIKKEGPPDWLDDIHEEEANSCSDSPYSRYKECWFSVPDGYTKTRDQALEDVGFDSSLHKVNDQGRQPGRQGCYDSAYYTYVCKNNGDRLGSILLCPCCYHDRHGKPVIKTEAEDVWKDF